MILPDKYISTSNSLLGVGAILIEHLNQPRTVTSLWSDLSKISEVATFERFILVLDLLYMIGAIELEEGLIYKRHR
ncbi:hypothetical protein IQ265_06210 [Nodosilinea sp. LEGE 06152]|uniref:ABC-three component system middle component 6 n=1 Tax=Nodosilinea sp. LEGE 06152 TaxID=2777966 RepID=UPI0018818E09|nr:ABC-three component system middle component 6 [Nodosilinea sp. LEGE 06152]MBE9156422.1 hypothetical protein [Nodosilinea sp. LEGE 06152]